MTYKISPTNICINNCNISEIGTNVIAQITADTTSEIANVGNISLIWPHVE
jgi:hypothetical protein